MNILLVTLLFVWPIFSFTLLPAAKKLNGAASSAAHKVLPRGLMRDLQRQRDSLD